MKQIFDNDFCNNGNDITIACINEYDNTGWFKKTMTMDLN